MAEAQKQSGDSDTHANASLNSHPHHNDTDATISDLYGRSLASVSKPEQPKVRATFNVENGLSGKAGEAGTFVSDKKKDRHSFFGNVAEAFSEWRVMTKKALEQRHLIEEEPEKKIADTMADIVSGSAKQAVPHLEALKSETIVPAPIIEKEVKHSNTIEDAARDDMPLKEALVETLWDTKKIEAPHRLQKIRTFKSDAARLQANKEDAPVIPVRPALPSKPPEPKPVKATPKPPPKLVKKDVHVAPLDMRASMIAPEVNVRLNGTAIPAPPETSVKPKEKDENPIAPLVPHTQESESISPIAEMPHAPEVPAVTKEVPHWTHVLDEDTHVDDAPLTKVEKPQPVREPDADPLSDTVLSDAPEPPPASLPIPEPLAQRKDRVSRIEEKVRSMRSEKNPSPTDPSPLPNGPRVPFAERPLSELSDAVEPAREQESAIDPPLSVLTSNADASLEENAFHERIEAVRAPITRTYESATPISRPLPASFRKSSVHTRTALRFAFTIMLVVLIIGGFTVGRMYLFNHVKPTVETPPRTDPAPVIPVDTESHELVLGEDPQAFRAALAQAVTEAPSGITELSVYRGEPRRTATTQEFFAYLELGLPARTIRALEPVFVIGSVTTTRNEPFLLIRSNNFDALFAGLLAWEPTMQQDLTPLFGAVVEDTLQFTDAVRDNRSIRVLQNASSTEVMVYSFIDERTVVITTSMDALKELTTHF